MVDWGLIRGYSFYGVGMFRRILLGRVGERRLFLNYDSYLQMFYTQKVGKPARVHVGGNFAWGLRKTNNKDSNSIDSFYMFLVT